MHEKPTRNDEERGHGEWRAPQVPDGETLLFDECGRCSPSPQVHNVNSIDMHSHHFRVTKKQYGNGCRLLVKHGGGEESFGDLGAYECLVGLLQPLSSDARYLLLHAMYSIYRDAKRAATAATANQFREAFIEGRLKKRKARNSESIKVWIEDAERDALAGV